MNYVSLFSVFFSLNLWLLYVYRNNLFQKIVVYSYINIVKLKIISESYYLNFKQKYLTNSSNDKNDLQQHQGNSLLFIYVTKDNLCDEQVFYEEELEELFNSSKPDILEFVKKERDYINEEEKYGSFMAFYCKHINNNLYYYRIHENTSHEDIKSISICETPFIGIDLIYNNKEISLKEKLNSFYLSKNKILDHAFLVWFVERFCNIDLSDEYIVKIIDNEVNMFELKKNESQICKSIIL